MGEVMKENILIDYVSEKIFNETWDWDYGSGTSSPVKYMEVNVIGISDITSIKIGKLNNVNNNYWTAIKKRGDLSSTVSSFGSMNNMTDFVANYIGKNLNWINIKI